MEAKRHQTKSDMERALELTDVRALAIPANTHTYSLKLLIHCLRLCTYLSVCVYVCVYICVCVYVCVCVCVCVRVCVCVCVCVSVKFSGQYTVVCVT